MVLRRESWHKSEGMSRGRVDDLSMGQRCNSRVGDFASGGSQLTDAAECTVATFWSRTAVRGFPPEAGDPPPWGAVPPSAFLPPSHNCDAALQHHKQFT